MVHALGCKDYNYSMLLLSLKNQQLLVSPIFANYYFIVRHCMLRVAYNYVRMH